MEGDFISLSLKIFKNPTIGLESYMILASPQTISGQENLGYQDQSKEFLVNRD